MRSWSRIAVIGVSSHRRSSSRPNGIGVADRGFQKTGDKAWVPSSVGRERPRSAGGGGRGLRMHCPCTRLEWGAPHQHTPDRHGEFRVSRVDTGCRVHMGWVTGPATGKREYPEPSMETPHAPRSCLGRGPFLLGKTKAADRNPAAFHIFQQHNPTGTGHRWVAGVQSAMMRLMIWWVSRSAHAMASWSVGDDRW